MSVCAIPCPARHRRHTNQKSFFIEIIILLMDYLSVSLDKPTATVFLPVSLVFILIHNANSISKQYWQNQKYCGKYTKCL